MKLQKVNMEVQEESVHMKVQEYMKVLKETLLKLKEVIARFNLSKAQNILINQIKIQHQRT